MYLVGHGLRDREAEWLLYGIAPKNAGPTLRPGHCRGKVHQRQTLGFTGRRVLISRQWSNKTLTDHRDDNRAWVRALLELPDDQSDNTKPRFEYHVRCTQDYHARSPRFGSEGPPAIPEPARRPGDALPHGSPEAL
ncbi:replication initiator [Longispora fulva]|uniref:replication initiator n=1 Tax=Longispora fulva TaxID=619741 RepID=UPI0027DA23CC|nr:replication initiator [Longispora fulva]